MQDAAKRWNAAAIWSLLLAIGALSTNFVFFLNPPLQAVLPWLSLVLALAALLLLLVGLRRAVSRSQIYRGKALSIVLGVLTLLFAGASLYVFAHARALPNSVAAPRVGQQVPDFTLPDTSGQPVSLDSLFQSSGDSSSPAPEAVMLIFYRGYW